MNEQNEQIGGVASDPWGADAVEPSEEVGAAGWAAGLREFADWIDQHVDSPDLFLYDDQMTFYVGCQTKEAFQRVARMMGRGDKRELGTDLHLERSFGMVKVSAYTARENVCRKVVVAAEEVTREVPDPQLLEQVPLVTVTETVEKVEWVCGPIFSTEPGTDSVSSGGVS